MAPPNKVYLRDLSSTKRQQAKLGERIAGGGAGDIHRLPDRTGEVLKLYKTDKDQDLYAPKVEAMLVQPPTLTQDNPKFQQLAWPTAIAENRSGRFLGFSMPEIDFDGSVSLERMLQKRMRQVTGLPEFYGYRLSAAYNLTVCVAALHKRGHHIIDLKPVNCRLHAEEMLVSILDCDGFSVDSGGSGRFPAHQFTPEYIAPEAFGKDPDTLGEAQDLFALAVIIFKLLNNGIHPFQARLAPGIDGGTIQDMINADYYAYGVRASSKYTPAGQSVHAYFPDSLRKLFDGAFKSSSRPSAANWRDALKVYADPSSGKLLRCDKNPSEHAHFDKGCGWCELDEINQKPIKRAPPPKRRTRSAKRASSPAPSPASATSSGLTPAITLSSLSKMRSRTVLIFTVLAAVFLFYLNDFSGDQAMPPPQTKQSKPKQQQKPRASVPKKSPAPKAQPKQLPRQEPRASTPQRLPAPKAPKRRITRLNKSGFITGSASVRSGPGANFATILTLPPGTGVRIRGKVYRKNWYLIELTGKSGRARTKVQGFLHGGVVAIFN